MASDSTLLIEDDPGITLSSDIPDNPIEGHEVNEQVPEIINRVSTATVIKRETGDLVNRFMLCALVSESAKCIKLSAGKMGESLPMTMIVRSVLRAYRLAAKDEHGPLAESQPDIVGLQSLNEKVLRDEFSRDSRDKVRDSEIRLARAERLGDNARVKAEKEGLQQAIELRDRLNGNIR